MISKEETVFYKNWEESHEEVETFVPEWIPPKNPDRVVGSITFPMNTYYARFVQANTTIFSENPDFTAFLWNQNLNQWQGVIDGAYIKKDIQGNYEVTQKPLNENLS